MAISQTIAWSTLVWVLLVCRLSVASITLDPNDEFNVTWTLDDEEDPKFITFQLIARRQGWIALGFSPNGGMAGSDIIKASIDGDGNVELLDMYATDEKEPDVDKSPTDVELLGGSRTDGIFHVTFRRPLTNCDPQDLDITKDTVRLIFAWGDSDTFSYHGATSRGSKSVYLLDTLRPAVPDFEPGILVHDLNYEAGYLLPEGEHTMYTYGIVKMPPVTSKHHILSFGPKVTLGNEGLIHHMIVFACYHDLNVTKHLEEKVVYTLSMMPQDFLECMSNTMMTWGIGGGVYHFPERTGLAIGDDLAPKAWVLGIHYNNPTMAAGTIMDFSGMTIRYTQQLRENDIGYFLIGSTYGLYAPPSQKEFYTRGDCTSSCTQFFPHELKMFGYLLHAHDITRAIYAYRERNGKTELLAQDRFFDGNFQETRTFEPEISILPGDEFSVVCKMDSTNRTEMTYGGLAATEEMCTAFLYYYPRAAESPNQCLSKGLWTADGGWMDKLNDQKLSEETVEKLATKAMTEPYTQSCLGMTGSNKLEGKVFDPLSISIECAETCKPSTCNSKSWQARASSGTRIVSSFILLNAMIFFSI